MVGFKACVKILREKAQLKIQRNPDYAAGYLQALNDVEDVYSDITSRYYRSVR